MSTQRENRHRARVKRSLEKMGVTNRYGRMVKHEENKREEDAEHWMTEADSYARMIERQKKKREKLYDRLQGGSGRSTALWMLK